MDASECIPACADPGSSPAQVVAPAHHQKSLPWADCFGRSASRHGHFQPLPYIQPQPAFIWAAPAADPVSVNDPWKKVVKTSQARWEDLILQTPIPFFGTDAKAMSQTHRLQVSQARAGIAFTTKQYIPELLKSADKLDLALLVPTVDGSKPPNVYQTLEGPFEITVEDPVTSAAYKRLVLMLPAKGSISFRLPEPKLKLQTAAITEIVVELDSRLIPRQEFEHMQTQPLQSIKQQLAEALPELSGSFTIYGLRTTKHPGASKQDVQLQCMLKAPFSARTPILEASGRSYLFTRDYIDHNHEPTDTTILPRFWDTTPAEIAAMRITTKGIPGAAGLVATRRGLALRIWVKHIAAARQALLPGDDRLTEDNRHVVPRLTFQAAGWPPGTGPPPEAS